MLSTINNHTKIDRSIQQQDILERFGDRYIYLSRFIWHSTHLHQNITQFVRCKQNIQTYVSSYNSISFTQEICSKKQTLAIKR